MRAPIQRNKTFEELAKELGVTKNNVADAVRKLWNGWAYLFTSKEQRYEANQYQAYVAEVYGGEYKQKLLDALDEQEKEEAIPRIFRELADEPDEDPHLMFPAPHVEKRGKEQLYVLTDAQEGLIKCLLSSDREELVTRYLCLWLAMGKLWRVAEKQVELAELNVPDDPNYQVIVADRLKIKALQEYIKELEGKLHGADS